MDKQLLVVGGIIGVLGFWLWSKSKEKAEGGGPPLPKPGEWGIGNLIVS